MEQRYGTDPSRRYGTGVWNGGMERVWSRSLFRTSYFDLPPYIYIIAYMDPMGSSKSGESLAGCGREDRRYLTLLIRRRDLPTRTWNTQ